MVMAKQRGPEWAAQLSNMSHVPSCKRCSQRKVQHNTHMTHDKEI